MVRVVIYGVLAALTGALFGAAFGVATGAILGSVGCSMLGIYIAIYMNRKRVLDRPFFAESDVEPLLSLIALHDLSFLPARLSNRIISYIRTILESWL
jgi:hypothetical protein